MKKDITDNKQEQSPKESTLEPVEPTKEESMNKQHAKESTNNAHQEENITTPSREQSVYVYGTLFITFLLFIATATLAVLSYLQWKTISEQLVTMNRQADIMSQQMINGQRAWVIAVDGRYDKFQSGETTNVTIIFINSGNTPALNVITIYSVAFRNEPIPEPMPSLQPPITKEIPSKAIIATHDTVRLIMPTPEKLNDSLITNLNQMNIYMFVWGIVEYDDIFGQHHKTYFCLLNAPDTNVLQFCENNNTAD